MLRRTEYKEKRESVIVSNWHAAKTIAFGLLESGYNVRIGRSRVLGTSDYAYKIDFVNPEWDGADFAVTGDYDEIETIENITYVEYKQSMNSINWDQTEKIAEQLVDNDYEIYIWTDGETFGGTKPKNYTIHFVHINDHLKIELVE